MHESARRLRPYRASRESEEESSEEEEPIVAATVGLAMLNGSDDDDEADLFFIRDRGSHFGGTSSSATAVTTDLGPV